MNRQDKKILIAVCAFIGLIFLIKVGGLLYYALLH
jgi:hypothetical protein